MALVLHFGSRRWARLPRPQPGEPPASGSWDSPQKRGVSDTAIMLLTLPVIPQQSHARMSSMARSRITTCQTRPHVNGDVPRVSGPPS